MHSGGMECCRRCQNKRNESTACKSCDRPPAYPENAEAISVFWSMSTQWRSSMAGVMGLDYNALDKVMHWLGVQNKAACFEKIRILESEQLKIIHGNKN